MIKKTLIAAVALFSCSFVHASAVSWKDISVQYKQFDFQEVKPLNGFNVGANVQFSDHWYVILQHDRISASDVLIDDVKMTSLGLGFTSTIKNIETPTDLYISGQRGSFSVANEDDSYWLWSMGFRSKATNDIELNVGLTHESFNGFADEDLSGTGFKGSVRYQFTNELSGEIQGVSARYDTVGVGLVYSF